MAHADADGMVRINLKWKIEGAKRTRTGKLFGLHEQEVAAAIDSLKLTARRGDTLTYDRI